MVFFGIGGNTGLGVSCGGGGSIGGHCEDIELGWGWRCSL